MKKADWLRMYEVAEEIQALKPWEIHVETEIVALQPRAEGPVYFASIMGREKGHYAIAYYQGAEAFSNFQLVQSGTLPDRAAMEQVLMNPHFQVAFERKQNLIPPELAVLKSLKRVYRGKWPAFRSHMPARMPWVVNDEEAADLLRLMEMTRDILRRGDPETFRPCFSDEFFLLTADGRDSVCRVQDLPIPRRIVRAPVPIGALNGLKSVDACFELELFVMLSPVCDVPKNEPPYFPLGLLLAHADSGAVLAMEVLSTKNGVEEAIARIPETLIAALKRAGVKPAMIAARHPVLLSLLELFSSTYGISCEEDDELPAVEEAMDSLMAFMAGRG